jgi:hypothetical protein
MSSTSRATFTLACQAAETVVGLAVVRVVTAGAMKKRGPPTDPADTLFNYSLKVSAIPGANQASESTILFLADEATIVLMTLRCNDLQAQRA